MEVLIRDAIEREAKKRLSKYSRQWFYIHKHRAAFTRRTGVQAATSPHALPPSWSFHPHFDPRYCLNHSRFLARGIWRALQAGLYRPTNSLRIEIPKPTGGVRAIDSFSVLDAAIAKIFLNNLRKRNAKIFSDGSYAYQVSKTPLDAVLRVKSALKSDTVFVSQYDFSSYFDSINHEYVNDLLSQAGPFLTTAMERGVISSVLTHRYAKVGGSVHSRTIGTPQGNSISLFVANVAAHPLDDELSRLNGTFARFADDSVVINTSYEDALKTAAAFHSFSRRSGVSINLIKSSGVRLFSDRKMEMKHISEFDFLGYKFSRSGLFMGDRAKAMIKRRCAKIIFNHLLLHVRRTGSLGRGRIGNGFRDWDLVTCVNELRGFIYGGSSQAAIEEHLNGTRALKNISGSVSYFALVENGAIFRELDGWLADILYRAYEERRRILMGIGRRSSAKSKSRLISGSWYNFPRIPQETRLPSFFLAWRAARKSWSRHGLGGVDPHGLGYVYS